MKKVISLLALIVALAGVTCLACSSYALSSLKTLGYSGSEWMEILSSRTAAADKVQKMASSLSGTIGKWDETDAAWLEKTAKLNEAASAAASAITSGGDASVWNAAYAEWSDDVSELNASEDESLAALRKNVKSLNRQVKSTAESFKAWDETEEKIAAAGFDPDHSFTASCIRFRQLLLYVGILLVVAGIFLFPAVREALSKSQMAVGYMFIAPAVLFMLIFVAYPIIYNVILSFRDVDITNINFRDDQHFIGFKNYISLFTTDDQMLGSIKNTLIFTVASIFFQFIIGFLLALLFRNRFPLGGFIRGAIMISWLIPVTVSGLLFKFMFGMNGGIINQFLGTFGIQPIEWLYSVDFAMPAVVVANIWIGIPFNMVLLLTGLTTIPQEIYESAEIDGAKGLRRLFSITIPMIKPAIMSVLTLGFVYTFKVFDLVKVMTSGGPVNRTQLVSIFAYKLAFEKYEYSMGAAAATIMFIILLIEGLFYIRAIKDDEVM